MSAKCIVKNCLNHTHEGQFVGDLCMPCYSALINGRAPKIAHDTRELRTFMQSMQSGEMTVSRGLEIIDMWLAGNYSDDQVPPARNGLGEDEMPWDRIDRLTFEVQQATEERDQKDLLLKSVTHHFDEAVDCARLLGSTHANHRYGCFTEQDSRFVRAMYEAIAKHRKEACGK